MANTSTTSSTSFFSFLFRAVDPHGLAIFRIFFGLVMAWEMIYMLDIDFVEIFFTLPDVQFTYDGLDFLRPLPEIFMYGLLGFLLGCCILITIGRLYRPAMLVFAIGFTYIFFLEKAYYNNHLYLICLISWWMVFIEADKTLVLGGKKHHGEAKMVPAWMYHILQAQLFIVYFYGGIAKLNADWLIRQEPVRTILSKGSFIADILGIELGAYFIAYGGMLFDLSIGFLLLIPKTRKLGLVGVLIFNILNANIFDDINIFPYFMMFAAILFINPATVKAYLTKLIPPAKDNTPKRKKTKKKRSATKLKIEVKKPTSFAFSKPLLVIMGIYLAIQLLFPFRHVLIPGPVDWTAEGQRFSWRMKIQYRTLKRMEFKVFDFKTKTIHPIDLAAYQIALDQESGLYIYPEMTWQFAQFLKKRASRKLNSDQIEVKAEIEVGFNGRPPQYMVDPKVDLASAKRSMFKHSDWIMELK